MAFHFAVISVKMVEKNSYKDKRIIITQIHHEIYIYELHCLHVRMYIYKYVGAQSPKFEVAQS